MAADARYPGRLGSGGGDLVAAGRLDPLAVPTTEIAWDTADQRWLEPALKMVAVRG